MATGHQRLIWLISSYFVTHVTSPGVRCYVCDSKLHEGCGPKPDPGLLLAEERVQENCITCSKVFVGLGTAWSHVTRACYAFPTDHCVNILGYGKCYCNKDLCNSAVPSRIDLRSLQASFCFTLSVLYILI